MEQLSGLDASFLALESPTQAGHVGSVAIYSQLESTEDSVFPELCRTLGARIAGIAALRQRLVTVPFALDRPYWAADPDFDLDFHLRHVSVPPPGRDAQLAELIARLHALPLDRTRPLWEMYVIEGLEHGRFALYTKLHHAAFDGLAAVALLRALSDDTVATTPSGVDAPKPADATLPGSLEMLARGALGAARRPRRAFLSGVRAALAAARGGSLGGIAIASGILPYAHSAGLGRVPGLYRALERLNGAEDTSHCALPSTPAPRTPWNRAITKHRRWAPFTLSRSDVKQVCRAFGVSVNDVVLALTAHALRRELHLRGSVPAEPLIAMVPASLRAEGDMRSGGNRVYMALTDLATDEIDPVERLQRIHRAMSAAKRTRAAIPSAVLEDLGQIGANLLAGSPARALSRAGLGDRLRPAFNVTVTSVPGPREMLHLCGARLNALYPLSVVAEGQGLSVTVVSYRDRLHFGLTACRELMPDLADLGGGFSEGLELLCKRAEALSAQPVH
jgi:diacylglycerol O-acyltransferase